VIRLLGIDPGTDTLGVAITDVSIDTYEPTLVYADTFVASREIRGRPWAEELRGGRDLRLVSHYERLYELMRLTTPTLVSAESPFLGRGRVDAFAALVECHAMLRAVCWDYSPSLYLRRIDPITVKNAVGVSHIKTTKDDVRAAILTLYQESCAEEVPLLELDEHAIDATAVNHAVLRKFLLDESFSMKKPKTAKKSRRRKKRKAS
jgi:Holliday junction resolvasome RuvABC endonuclease subunit